MKSDTDEKPMRCPNCHSEHYCDWREPDLIDMERVILYFKCMQCSYKYEILTKIY